VGHWEGGQRVERAGVAVVVAVREVVQGASLAEHLRGAVEVEAGGGGTVRAGQRRGGIPGLAHDAEGVGEGQQPARGPRLVLRGGVSLGEVQRPVGEVEVAVLRLQTQ